MKGFYEIILQYILGSYEEYKKSNPENQTAEGFKDHLFKQLERFINESHS